MRGMQGPRLKVGAKKVGAKKLWEPRSCGSQEAVGAKKLWEPRRDDVRVRMHMRGEDAGERVLVPEHEQAQSPTSRGS